MTGIVVRSKIKEIIKKIDPEETVNNIAADIGDTLDKMVEEILQKGIDRARKNQRKTLLSRDL
ncbi:NFYB/HAP3 family transcription factor subunit [Candidatus Pacearchaeota archaeon]|nr:NFYB/HAP3 family transcription factor subunit [Candidatus Pacearchaeota archaeon]